MREILFRGKTLKTNKWVYGGYYTMQGRTFIVSETEYTPDWGIGECDPQHGYRMYEVHPNSVGQYIDDVDNNGTKIFEGDIVYIAAEDEYANVYWNEATGSFEIGFDCWCSDFDHFYGHELEVSGNTFDEGWHEFNG